MGINVQWNRIIWLAPVVVAALLAVFVAAQAGPEDRPAGSAVAFAQEVQQPAALPRLAPGDCGRLCDNDFWASAGPGEVRAEVARGADLTVAEGDMGGRALHIAATYSGDPAAIAALLDAGADLEAANLLLGATPLHLAAGFNPEPAVAARLLEAGANPEARTVHGWSAVHMALGMNANPEVAALLMDHGANMTAKVLNAPPMHAAAFNPEPAVAAMMLERGTDVMTRSDTGRTSLHTAARHNPNPAVIELLLTNGADIAATTETGMTPLHAAAEYSPAPASIVRTLLIHGAEAGTLTDDGRSACDFALESANPDGETLTLLCR